MGRWEVLIELARRAQAEGLGPLAAVETNAFWAIDDHVVERRLGEVRKLGVEALVVSTPSAPRSSVTVRVTV